MSYTIVNYSLHCVFVYTWIKDNWDGDTLVIQPQEKHDQKSMSTVLHGPSGPLYMCNTCNRTYTTMGNLGRHQTYECKGNVAKPSFVCFGCKKGYKRRDHLLRHMKSFCSSKNIPVYRCELCQKPCKGEYFFHHHMRTKHGVRRSHGKPGETILGLD